MSQQITTDWIDGKPMGIVPRRDTIYALLEACADAYGVTAYDLLSRSRQVPIPFARQMACFIADRCLGLSMSMIAECVGYTSHSMVSKAVSAVCDRIATDRCHEAIADRLMREFLYQQKP
jgi:chromosomal replication initiation ATPase DnaA